MRTLGERLNGLRWRLKATRGLWSPGVSPDMPYILPKPFDSIADGRLDSPQAETEIDGEMLSVRGWVSLPSGPTARVEVWLGETPLGRARLGVPRADLEQSTGSPAATVSGFELLADLPASDRPLGETAVRAVATSVTGERLELAPVQVTVSAVRDEPSGSSALPALPPRTPHAADGTGLRVLVCTHQLNLGGAQLYLLDLLQELIGQGTVQPTVVSALDGILRKNLEGMGVPVHITGPAAVDSLSSSTGHIEELALWAADRDFDVALVNTATVLVLPGAGAAAELGIPAVWAVHESFPPAVIWAGMDPEIKRRAEATLATASSVIFEAEATRELFAGLLDPAQSAMLPYGLDLTPIDRERAQFDRNAARREAGIPADATVVACIGTVEPRKAQIPLAHAFDRIADQHPDARLAFVGGSKNPDSKALAAWIEASRHRDRLMLIPITPDVQAWYGIADVLVCASDIESLPRTVLEAMAWETPVLATSVFGLPELIDDGETGWLCEPRDVGALADALDRVLRVPSAERSRVARNARALVERRHSLPNYAAQVSGLLGDAAASKQPSHQARKTSL